MRLCLRDTSDPGPFAAKRSPVVIGLRAQRRCKSSSPRGRDLSLSVFGLPVIDLDQGARLTMSDPIKD